MNIEERGALLSKNLEKLYEQHWRNSGVERKIHVVAYSFCGIDARAAISLYGANKYVSSLTTICTPHLGLQLIDNYNRNRNRHNLEEMDRPLEILGISMKNVMEFGELNMTAFNEVAED
mmetsp:Transcript_23424/g.23064  ORF Transcript_23424/g.23064 Transcript_23424/m.23064 type:complete len:119 (+) Transcript_23424:188-544(+)|eukprot:CAMPEP_0170568140 /NCGR_PEP_ID=MMETSP0211-20121228/80958_1 /TAXON_ID=311385 /ORGANISM="Pseudokeronopsis sp., Strain OXSARD2" /LENGTH=118 /DNA_ID=CAMNT_0010889851 /DNA_START=121 /DNA_END=477 /DNA_ORIENTATION=+